MNKLVRVAAPQQQAAQQAAPQPTGLGFQVSTAEGIALAGGLAVAGGLLGYYLGGKKHGALGAGIGAVAGLVAIPVTAGLIGFQK